MVDNNHYWFCECYLKLLVKELDMIIINQLEACGYIKEEFSIYGDKIQEVLFCPIVNSFFPEKWKKEEMVKSIIFTIENKDPEYENSYILKYENEFDEKINV